ncbi:MAG: CinA family protein [Pseudomonadota bacterium]
MLVDQCLQELHSILKRPQYKGLGCVTAESCTGGGIGEALTSISGISQWYWGGWITYSNQMKQDFLHVPKLTLKNHGAVSPETVSAMALHAAQQADANISVAVSGIAGPDGGSIEKPVGTVYFAWTCSVFNIDLKLVMISFLKWIQDEMKLAIIAQPTLQKLSNASMKLTTSNNAQDYSVLILGIQFSGDRQQVRSQTIAVALRGWVEILNT